VSVRGIALWPGAGSSASHPTLVAIESGLAPLPVGRFDFPYRREGRKAPDRANRLIESLRRDVSGWCLELGTTSGRLVLGGRSMGGRMASMAAAGATGNTAKGAAEYDEPLPVAGLVLLSYPLHPPGRPERMRTAHLSELRSPVLLISGDRDPFGTPEELATAFSSVQAPVTTVLVPSARHELSGADEVIVTTIRDWLETLRD
jgi:uncharacterized protein